MTGQSVTARPVRPWRSDEGASCGDGYGMVFPSFQKREELIRNEIRGDQWVPVGLHPLDGRRMIGVTADEIRKPSTRIHEDGHQSPP